MENYKDILRRAGLKKVLPDGRLKFESCKDPGSWKGKKLETFDVTRHNLEILHKYSQLLESKGRKPITIGNYLYMLTCLADKKKTNLEDMTEDDLLPFVNNWAMNKKRFKKPSSRNFYKQVLRGFFKWLHKKKEPECVAFIEYEKVRSGITSEDLLGKDDVQKLIDTATDPQGKLIPILLYESMFRRGEIVSCRIKDVTFHPEGYATLTIPTESVSKNGVAKTGSYEALLFESVPYLKQHLNSHPDGKNGNAPLLYNRNISHKEVKPLEPCGLYMCIRRLGKKALPNKKVWLHLFRHSGNTELARKGYTAQEINLASGRQLSSKAGYRYIHMTGGDVKRKRLQRAGILPADNETETKKLPEFKCWNCGSVNPGNNVICIDCDMPLHVRPEQKERFQDLANRIKTGKAIEKIEGRPEAYKILMDALERIAALVDKKKN